MCATTGGELGFCHLVVVVVDADLFGVKVVSMLPGVNVGLVRGACGNVFGVVG